MEFRNEVMLADPERLAKFAAWSGAFRRYGGQQDLLPSAEYAAGGVAIVRLMGLLTKSATWYGTSTVGVRRDLRDLVADSSVKSILLLVESPGGTAAGTPELAAEIAAAAKAKPLVAFIEDLAASAAYWAASQASEVYVNETGQVGSIGTYGVIADSSEAAENAGIKVHVVRAGKFKGMGVPGTEITGEHLAIYQERIDEINEFFLAGVAKGRKMSLERVRELADGRLHIGQKAVRLGLVDGVRTFEDVLAMMQQGHRPGAKSPAPRSTAAKKTTTDSTASAVSTKGNPMPSTPTKSTSQEWDEAVAAAMERGLSRMRAVSHVARTKPQLRAEYVRIHNQHQQRQPEAASTSSRTPTAAARSQSLPGVVGLVTRERGSAAGEVRERWDAAIAEAEGRGLSRMKAVAHVVRTQPDLHKQFLAETNANRTER